MELPATLRGMPPFRLHTDYGVKENCTAADVETALREVYYDRRLAFIVLEPETPVQNVRFMQAKGRPNGFQVELSVLQGGSWQMYERQVAYAETLEKYFTDFMEGRIPPLDGFTPYSL